MGREGFGVSFVNRMLTGPMFVRSHGHVNILIVFSLGPSAPSEVIQRRACGLTSLFSVAISIFTFFHPPVR